MEERKFILNEYEDQMENQFDMQVDETDEVSGALTSIFDEFEKQYQKETGKNDIDWEKFDEYEAVIRKFISKYGKEDL